MTLSELDVKRQKLATKLKWALGLGFTIIISPVIFMAIQGLVGLIVAGVITIAAINFFPVITMKFANWKIKGIIAEAKSNPIETMVAQAAERARALELTKQSITSTRAEVTSFKKKATELAKKYPQEAKVFEEQAAKMERLLLYRVEKWQTAKENLKIYYDTIEKSRILWEMSLEAQRLNKLAGAQEENFMEKLKTEVSLDSVNKSLELAFSEMESALMEEGNHIPTDYTPSIEFKPLDKDDFIEAEVVQEPALKVVRRGAR